MLLLLSVLLVGAGSSVAHGPSPTPPRLRSACDLITRAEVQQALGRPVTMGLDRSEGGGSICEFQAGEALMTLSIQRLGTKLNIAREIASLKQALPGSTVRPVEGIGAVAYLLDLGAAGAQLHAVRDGTEYLLISILGFGDSSLVSGSTETLARRALARVGQMHSDDATPPRW